MLQPCDDASHINVTRVGTKHVRNSPKWRRCGAFRDEQQRQEKADLGRLPPGTSDLQIHMVRALWQDYASQGWTLQHELRLLHHARGPPLCVDGELLHRLPQSQVLHSVLDLLQSGVSAHDNPVFRLSTLPAFGIHRALIYKSRPHSSVPSFCYYVFRLHVSARTTTQVFIHEPDHLWSRHRL